MDYRSPRYSSINSYSGLSARSSRNGEGMSRGFGR